MSLINLTLGAHCTPGKKHWWVTDPIYFKGQSKRSVICLVKDICNKDVLGIPCLGITIYDIKVRGRCFTFKHNLTNYLGKLGVSVENVLTKRADVLEKTLKFQESSLIPQYRKITVDTGWWGLWLSSFFSTISRPLFCFTPDSCAHGQSGHPARLWLHTAHSENSIFSGVCCNLNIPES